MAIANFFFVVKKNLKEAFRPQHSELMFPEKFEIEFV